jgi:plasmid maintenance system antidote protein VapI
MLNGHNGVTADMAIRLEKAGWGSAESWLRNQVSYDLWRAKKRARRIKVKKFPTLEFSVNMRADIRRGAPAVWRRWRNLGR